MFLITGKKNLSFLFIITITILLNSCAHNNPQKKYKMATSYFQHSPEVVALYYQAYNAANDRLKPVKKGRGCVVLDVDETVLDNSPYQGWLFENKLSYTDKTWEQWVNKGTAKALPGAISFIKAAQKKNYRVYLITNRKKHLEEVTYQNILNLGLKIPRKNLVGRDKTSSKVERRNKLTKGCQLTLLAGDSLGDFGGSFEGSIEERRKATHSASEWWGRRFFILPNPMYGDWTRKEGKLPLKATKLP